MKTVNYMSRPARAPTSFRFRPSDFDRRPAHDDGIIRCEARRTQATWGDGTRQLVTGNSRSTAPAHPANSAALEAFRVARSWRLLANIGRARLFWSRLLQRECS